MKMVAGFDYIKRQPLSVRRRDAVADIKSAKASGLRARADQDTLILAIGPHGRRIIREYYDI